MTEKKFKVFTAEEVSEHDKPTSAYIVIKDKVYDVTKFLSEHPGGDKVLLEVAGQDATMSFNDVGHSMNVWSIAKAYQVGYINEPLHDMPKGNPERESCSLKCFVGNLKEIIISPTWSNFLIPLAISLVVYAAYSFIKKMLV